MRPAGAISKLTALEATRLLLVPDVLDVPELARWLRCSHSTARAHLRAGRIQGRRLGHRWLTTRDALLQAISQPGASQIPSLKIVPSSCEPGGPTHGY